MKLALFSFSYLAAFSVFCCYLLITIFWFLSNRLLGKFSVPIGLLYMWCQPVNYYLFHMPLMVVLLSKITGNNEYENLILSRCPSNKQYEEGNILAVCFLVVTNIILMAVTAMIVFAFASNNTVPWRECYLFLKQQGIILLNNNLFDTSVLELIIIQLSLTILSFVSLGIFILLLQSIVSDKRIAIIISLCVNSVVYLGSRSDLPSWLDMLMPYRYLFLIYFTGNNHYVNALLYWIGIITLSCLLLIYHSNCKDFMVNDNETTF